MKPGLARNFLKRNRTMMSNRQLGILQYGMTLIFSLILVIIGGCLWLEEKIKGLVYEIDLWKKCQ